MKYLITLTGIIMILSIIITVQYYPTADDISPGSAEKAHVRNMVNEITMSFPGNEYKYYISVSSGRVALFEAGNPEPVRITGTRVRDLPETDRKALETGIGAYDLKAAGKLLEEYCS